MVLFPLLLIFRVKLSFFGEVFKPDQSFTGQAIYQGKENK